MEQPSNEEPKEVESSVESSVEPLKVFYNINKDSLTYTEYKDMMANDTPMMILPACTNEEIIKLAEELPAKEIVANYSDSTKSVITDIVESRNSINIHDISSKDEMPDSYTNEPKSGDKTLVIKSLETKIKSGNHRSIKIKLSSAVGIGNPIHVPLWHSGMWVTIKPLTATDKINLQMALSEEEDRVGRLTHGLIYSNYTVIFAKILVDVLRVNIVDSSLNVPDDKDIFDFIKIQDLNILVWGLLRSMHPRGFNYLVYCKNTTKVNDDKDISCTFRQDVKLDLSKLLWVDESIFTDTQKRHMVKRSSKIVTVEEITEYQENLSVNDTVKIKPNLEGLDITLYLNNPSISTYLEHGDMFITTLRDEALSLLENGTLVDGDNLVNNVREAENLLIKAVILNIYTHYIQKIVVDGEITTDVSEIISYLDILSENSAIRKKVVNSILDYIDTSIAAVIGIPDYTCPTCGKNQVENGKGPFKSFIGIDVFIYFFGKLAFQFQTATKDLELE